MRAERTSAFDRAYRPGGPRLLLIGALIFAGSMLLGALLLQRLRQAQASTSPLAGEYSACAEVTNRHLTAIQNGNWMLAAHYYFHSSDAEVHDTMAAHQLQEELEPYGTLEDFSLESVRLERSDGKPGCETEYTARFRNRRMTMYFRLERAADGGFTIANSGSHSDGA
jgi:hypothetical protein